ncbi:MAG: hypothetical protein JO297_15780 [Nitrososphaeraceae archaeon]|nr:hypothetical protein [Nitrososphaeraceae archaeon]
MKIKSNTTTASIAANTLILKQEPEEQIRPYTIIKYSISLNNSKIL